ncbi:MAG: GAF domain-containing protein [Comamonadaceae bacterium]|nr:MAG: GAF domain-containing protein [Comamonadaceae bacterium]
MQTEFFDYEPNDMTVRVSELLIATSDDSDQFIDAAVQEMLSLLRAKMQMDIVFVSEFSEGELVLKYLDSPVDAPVQRGQKFPLEETWCQRVVKGRLPPFIANCNEYFATAELLKKVPFPIGTFYSVPIVLANGSVYGTLCCLSYEPLDTPDAKDLNRLKYTAQMTANRIDKKTLSPGDPNLTRH